MLFSFLLANGSQQWLSLTAPNPNSGSRFLTRNVCYLNLQNMSILQVKGELETFDVLNFSCSTDSDYKAADDQIYSTTDGCPCA